MTPPLDPLLSPQAQQAVIAGLFLAVGWWVVAWQGRRRDAKLRAERVRDVQRAIFAEIRANLAVIEREELLAHGNAVLERIGSEPGYFPIVPSENADVIFRAIVADIHVLPRDTIDPVVLYYNQSAAVSAAVGDLRAIDIAKVPADRAAAMYRDYLMLKLGSIDVGEAALAAIRANMDGTGRVSSPAASASGRGSA